MTPDGRPIVIIDLDGTLVPFNTFTRFVKTMVRVIPSRFPAIISIVAARKLRLITHAAAKQRLLAIAARMPATAIKDYAALLSRNLDPAVAAYINPTNHTIIATAAPELYVAPLCRIIGADAFTATPTGGEENAGERKLRSLLDMGIVFTPDVTVITDDTRADAPLLRANAAASGRNIIWHR